MEKLKMIGKVLGRSEMRKIMAGSGDDCDYYQCCNSAGVCTRCVHAPGGGTCGSNDTKEYCCD